MGPKIFTPDSLSHTQSFTQSGIFSLELPTVYYLYDLGQVTFIWGSMFFIYIKKVLEDMTFEVPSVSKSTALYFIDLEAEGITEVMTFNPFIF